MRGEQGREIMRWYSPYATGNSCGEYIGHVVFESSAHHVVVPRTFAAITLPGVAAHTVQAPNAGSFDPFHISGQHSTFGGSHVLGGIERKTSHHWNWSSP